MKQNIFLVLLFLSVTLQSFSQNEGKVVAKSFVKQDTILLRFGASSTELFREGLLKGYKIERFEDKIENTASKTEVIIPASKTIIQTYENSNDERLRDIANIIGDYLKNDNLEDKSNDFMFAVLLLSSSVDADFMQALGLIYKDTDIDEKAKYVYRISINNGKALTNKNSTIISVNSKKLDKNIDFESLKFEARIKRKNVFLQWNATELEPYYAGYWIEKSLDSINFTPLNNVPYQFLKSQYEQDKTDADYLDTAVVEGGTYYYRIRGINHFAEKGGYSNIVKVYVRKSLKGEVRIDSIYANKFDRIVNGNYLSFNANDDNQLSKFIVLRSDSMSFGYAPIDVPNLKEGTEFEFIVPSPLETGDRFYYKVAAISVDNDTIYSFHSYFFTLDQKPPEIPTGLKGTIDDNGIVLLEWDKNPDNDIRGYRVFWTNSLKEEFVESTTHFVEGTTYTDTISLRNLTSEIYYQIRAVDLNYNNSKNCKPVKLMKPDTIPPVPCVFTKYKVSLNGVYLAWNNSSSIDVENNILIRENSKTHFIDTLIQWSDTTSMFQDQMVIPGHTYIYTIITSDEQPNPAQTDPLAVIYETGTRLPVQNLESEVNREEKQIKLTWEQDNTDVYSYKIYRSKGDGSYKLYKTLKGIEVNEFIDSNLYINNIYHYKIKTVYKSGVNSSFSVVLDVTY